MNRVIDYAIENARLALTTLLFLLAAGWVAYSTIPKEAEPDVTIPTIFVNVTQNGISPEDSERLILRPLETKLRSVEAVNEPPRKRGGFRPTRTGCQCHVDAYGAKSR